MTCLRVDWRTYSSAVLPRWAAVTLEAAESVNTGMLLSGEHDVRATALNVQDSSAGYRRARGRPAHLRVRRRSADAPPTQAGPVSRQRNQEVSPLLANRPR